MRTMRYFLALAAGMAVIACSKEPAEVVSPVDAPVGPDTPAVSSGTFYAGFDDDDTKVAIDGTFALSWEENDEVAVYKVKGGEATKLTYTATSSGPETTLTGDAIDEEAEYYAVYPASAAAGFEGGKPIITVPASQAITAGTLPSAAVMVSTCSGSTPELTFKNVCALVEFTIGDAYADVVKTVTFQGAGSENVAGTGSVSVSAAPAVASFSIEAKTLVLTPAAGSTFAAGTYYAAVLPGSFSGINVKLFDTNGKEASLSTTVNGGSIVRSSRLTLGTITGVKTPEYNRTISDASQFVNFLGRAADDGSETWTIANDIDLAGVEIPSASSFAGTLNGGSHTIDNLALTGPLFTTLSGTVRDLTIGSGSTLAFSHIAGSYGYIAGTNSGTIDLISVNGNISADSDAFSSPVESTYVDMCVGAIAGTNSGSISNCTNNADFAVVSDVSKYTPTYLGGIVGKQATTTALSGCENTGNVSLNTPSRSGSHISANCFVGGILGGTEYGETVGAAVNGCINSGSLEVIARDGSTSLPEIKLGGIAGYLDGALDDCDNSGAITHTNPTETEAGSSFRNCTIAGIAGTVTGAIAGCDNTGEVTVSGSFCYSSAGTETQTFFGGVAGYAGSTVSNCTNTQPLTMTAMMNSTSASVTHNGYFGGIAGYVADAIDGCTNSGALDIHSTFNTAWVGGIGGYTHGTIGASSLCSNSGAITYDFVNTEANGNQAKKANIGGISGQHAGTDCTIKANSSASSGNITINNGYYGADNITNIGGIAGHSVGAVNGTAASSVGRATYSGTITVNSDIQVRVGGIVGEMNKTLLYVCFSGNISIPNLGTKSCVGGFSGVKSASVNMGGSTLTGKVSCNYSGEKNTTNNVRVGLCHGIVTGTMTTHSTTIGAAAKLTTSGGIYAGIFAGSASVALTMGNVSNAFTYRPGVSFNGNSVSAVDDLTDDFLVGRLYSSGAITRTNLKVE